MYSTALLLGITSLMVASTAAAQVADRALLNLAPSGHGIVSTSGHSATAGASGASAVRVTGERALLGTVENRVAGAEPADATHAPIDGARALLGRWPSPISSGPLGGSGQFRFLGKVRGDVSADASGPAEFGLVRSGDDSPQVFVVSLGGRGELSAIMFTHMSGTPLGVGRYRISDSGEGSDEVLALVMTGSPTNPTGVFRGRSGWLVVTAASDRLLTGRFEVDAIGFRAAEQEREDRVVTASGSFSAGAVVSSSQPTC
jgi:hypothetical protein